MTKTCARCGATKSLSDFYPKGITRPGEYHSYCKPCFHEKNKEFYTKHREYRNQHKRDLTRSTRIKVIQTYGAFCTCCGLDDVRFLCLVGGKMPGMKIYYWAIKNRYPDTLYVLCYNCHVSRIFNGGVCPHVSDNVVTSD